MAGTKTYLQPLFLTGTAVPMHCRQVLSIVFAKGVNEGLQVLELRTEDFWDLIVKHRHSATVRMPAVRWALGCISGQGRAASCVTAGYGYVPFTTGLGCLSSSYTYAYGGAVGGSTLGSKRAFLKACVYVCVQFFLGQMFY